MKLFFGLLIVAFSFPALATSGEKLQEERSRNDASHLRPEGEIQDMRTMYGGSLGGARSGENEIQREEAPGAVIEGKSFQSGDIPINCEEAQKVCE